MTETVNILEDGSSQSKPTPLLEVKDFSLSFKQYTSGLREKDIQVIKGLDLTIEQGEIVAIVGASGSGKSLLANAILGILPENASVQGSLLYKGDSLGAKQTEVRGNEITLIPQSINALDPLMKNGKQVRTVIKDKKKRKSMQREVFQKLGLTLDVENKYPFQLSGGMARRVLIATVMVSEAQLAIADEPTPGLDEQVLKETIRPIRQLADEGMGIMSITHDIATALHIADKVAVMYAGTIVEMANVEDFTGKGEALRHPYTKALWNALPENGFNPIPGAQAHTGAIDTGCIFKSRCPNATPTCSTSAPQSRTVRGGMVRCFYD